MPLDYQRMSVWRVTWSFACLLLGCHRAVPVAADAGAGAGIDASPDAFGVQVPDAGVAPSAGQPLGPDTLVDTPAWPPKETQVHVTWIVHAESVAGADGGFSLRARKVDVSLRVGGVVRRLSLGETSGELLARYQALCTGARNLRGPTPEVSTLRLNRDGTHGYLLRRDGSTAVRVVAFSQDDGICPDKNGRMVSCPTTEAPMARVEIPPGAVFREDIVLTDGGAAERHFGCEK